MPTKWMARKRAQRARPNLANENCQTCGTARNLQRHHPDYGKPDVFQILCQPCHIKADQRDGHRRKKQEIPCKVCNRMFLPSHSKNHRTCSPACLSEIGRRNAWKRWHSGRTENGMAFHGSL